MATTALLVYTTVQPAGAKPVTYVSESTVPALRASQGADISVACGELAWNDLNAAAATAPLVCSECRVPLHKDHLRIVSNMHHKTAPRTGADALLASTLASFWFVCDDPACADSARVRAARAFKESVAQIAAAGVPKRRMCKVCRVLQREDSDVKMQQCARCKMVYYCSEACQARDWPSHKHGCKIAEKAGV